MKLLLDTTYLLPAIGIAIRDLPRDGVLKLIDKGYEIAISEISIFELAAKGAKYTTLNVISPLRVTNGLRAIIHDDRMRRIPIHDVSILSTALKLRRLLRDFIDCLIISTALYNADILLTEDIDIHQLSTTSKFKELKNNINPKLEVKSIKELV